MGGGAPDGALRSPRGEAQRHRFYHGGSTGAGDRPTALGSGEPGTRLARSVHQRRVRQPEGAAEPGAEDDRGAANKDTESRTGNSLPLRRQPAEGGHREVAPGRLEGLDHGRADAWDRRGGEGGDLRADERAHGGGCRYPDDIERSPGGVGHERPDTGDG